MTLILALLLAITSQKPAINTSSDLALRGYDSVAYFVDGRAVRGLPGYTTTWNGATWRFVSAANRETFGRTPEKYAPQFGGYCAWAVAHGYTADADPEAWKIVDGRLYLNYSRRVQRMWDVNIPGFIKEARANWPAVLTR